MNIPENLKYTKDHEWVRKEGADAYVGITDYAQGELGDIVFVEVETIGEHLKKGDVFGTIEAVKTVSDIFLPVMGEVLEVNSRIEKKPELINSDPYGDGWIIKLRYENGNDFDSLLSAEQYKAMITSH